MSDRGSALAAPGPAVDLWSQTSEGLTERQRFGPPAKARRAPPRGPALLPDDTSDPWGDAEAAPLQLRERCGSARSERSPSRGSEERSRDGSSEGDINKFTGPARHYHPYHK